MNSWNTNEIQLPFKFHDLIKFPRFNMNFWKLELKRNNELLISKVKVPLESLLEFFFFAFKSKVLINLPVRRKWEKRRSRRETIRGELGGERDLWQVGFGDNLGDATQRSRNRRPRDSNLSKGREQILTLCPRRGERRWKEGWKARTEILTASKLIFERWEGWWEVNGETHPI
jgi:hypothetical protein